MNPRIPAQLAETRALLSELYSILGNQAMRQSQRPDAEHLFTNALTLSPGNPDIHNALMYATAMQHKLPEAIDHATKAMTGTKKIIGPRYIRALCLLMQGDYKRGFEEFECRWDEKGVIDTLGADLPRWGGQPCKALHVFGEQGFGDIWMMSRYVPLIAARFNIDKIYFEVPKSCLRLFRYNYRNHPEIQVVSDRNGLTFDYSVQHMSLPYWFGTTYETVPRIKIEAEPEMIEKWASPHPYIALCWGGRPDAGDLQAQEWNGRRNIDAVKLVETLGGSMFIPLQKEFNDKIETWSDTAAIIHNAQLVISVDSGPVHLAAAMDASKVWLLNHSQPCWRWGYAGNYTPWYPEIIQIRQVAEGDWTGVLRSVRDMLACAGDQAVTTNQPPSPSSPA